MDGGKIHNKRTCYFRIAAMTMTKMIRMTRRMGHADVKPTQLMAIWRSITTNPTADSSAISFNSRLKYPPSKTGFLS